MTTLYPDENRASDLVGLRFNNLDLIPDEKNEEDVTSNSKSDDSNSSTSSFI